MPHKNLLSVQNSILMVVDIQTALQNHIADMNRVLDRTAVMIQAANLLSVPIIVTEQYPKGLGRTAEPLRNLLGDCEYHDKVAFSCLQDQNISDRLRQTSREQILLVGIETHVCILQTAYDALDLGLQPYLVVDALGSRRDIDKQTAIDRLRDAGAIVTTTESAILEMATSSKHSAFRQISKLLKSE